MLLEAFFVLETKSLFFSADIWLSQLIIDVSFQELR